MFNKPLLNIWEDKGRLLGGITSWSSRFNLVRLSRISFWSFQWKLPMFHCLLPGVPISPPADHNLEHTCFWETSRRSAQLKLPKDGKHSSQAYMRPFPKTVMAEVTTHPWSKITNRQSKVACQDHKFFSSGGWKLVEWKLPRIYKSNAKEDL